MERLDEVEQQGVIGAFDKRTIIELSSDVVKEIAQKYGNVQKGVGDIMGGALIETEARTILNQGIQKGIQKGIKQNTKHIIKNMLLKGMKIEEIKELVEATNKEIEEVRKSMNIA